MIVSAMHRGEWFKGCRVCRVLKVLVFFIATVTSLVFYSHCQNKFWGKMRIARAMQAPPVFWTAHLDGTREAIPRRPNGKPCGTGILSGETFDTLSKHLPINPLMCRCHNIENTGGMFPRCCLQYHVTLLRYVATTLPKFHLTFWLDFGTLLGAVREGGLMLHDTDVDIGLLIATVDDARNLDRFLKQATLDGFGPNGWYQQEKREFRTQNERGIPAWAAMWTWLVGGNPVDRAKVKKGEAPDDGDMFAINAMGEHLDIYIYHPCATCPRQQSTEVLTWNDGNGLIRPAEYMQSHFQPYKFHATRDLFPLSMNCNFQGWYLPCPRVHTKILQRYYGAGTKILNVDKYYSKCNGGCLDQENSTSIQNRFEMAMECLHRTDSNSLFELNMNMNHTTV